jgi:hypothetical protein
MNSTRLVVATVSLGACLAVAAPAFGVGMGKAQIANGQSGERQAITPLKLTKNVQGYTLEAGETMVCLNLRVKNVGKAAFEEFVGTGAKLRLKGGVTVKAQIAGGGVCKSMGLVKLKPGKAITGNLPFVLRKTDRIVGFEYTASSGFGTNTPKWTF